MQKSKYGIDELMEILEVFQVPTLAAAQIRAILAAQEPEPSAGVFFRYYNDRSKAEELERCFAAHFSSRHALAVNSGTSALIASLVAGGIGPGDEVIVPAYTFFASVSAVVVAKAIPVIVEIDESLTISPQAFAAAITPRTKAVMAVHMLGLPARMDAIREIARENNLLVIEDAAQACGGSFQGKYLGTWGDFGCISLDAYKVIGAGEGGVVLTDSDWHYMRAQSYHDTAACWRPDRYGKERQPGELFCGENYRISELSAAVALAQLRKLDWIISSCRRNCQIIRENCPLPAGVKWLECTDPDGICGYTLPLLFAEKEFSFRAQKAKVVGGNAGDATRGVRNWHLAWHWEHILEQKTASAEGCPFQCPLAREVPRYHLDSWPQTRDIIHRVGTISVSPHLTPAECQELGAKISSGLTSC